MGSMKKLKIVGLIVMFWPGWLMADDKQSYEYYAGMSGVISPFLEYHPVLPVTAQQAEGIRHYRVKRDGSRRLLEIAWFDKKTKANNSYFDTHKVTYQYSENGHSRRYFDAEGKPANMWRHYYQGGEIHHEKYSYSSKVREVTLHNANGQAIESTIGAHKFRAQTLDDRRYLQTQVNLAGKRIPFRNAMPFMAVTVSVDGDGYLDKVTNVDEQTLQPKVHSNAGYASLKVNFDENGLELGWEYQDATGSLVNLPSTDPDEPGAALTVWFKKWRNQSLNQWSDVWARYYDKTGAVVADKRGVYLMHLQKDSDNRLTDIRYLDKQGKLMFVESEGFARKQYVYKDDGGKPVEHLFDANDQRLSD